MSIVTQDPAPEMAPVITFLPLNQKAFVFTTSPTVREFLEQSPVLAPAIRQRYAEVRIPLIDQTFFVTYPDNLNFIVLLHEESPETIVVFPILMRIANSSPRFTLRILRDDDPLGLLATLVDEFDFTTDLADIDLPLLLIFDEEWNFQGHWGPHPQAAEPYLDQWFEQHPTYATLAEDESVAGHIDYAALLDELTHTMRVWYNSGLNRACVHEIHELLASFIDEGELAEQG
ncbi:MAG: thioredoxin family protein [Chloroflexota bacterium]|nr:thioredoxin family protein [Chloroflexota bacterium]